MSNTYKHKLRAKLNKEFKNLSGKDYQEAWDKCLYRIWSEAYGYGLYSSCPKEWNKLHHIRPTRRKEKASCNKVTIENMGEDIMFPLDKKPHIYYW